MEAIGETFGIPFYHSMNYKTKDRETPIYDAGPDRCAEKMNKTWMQKPRPHISKMPKQMTSLDFKQEYVDLVMMLNMIMGCQHAFTFETWMFFFVGEVMKYNGIVDWARLISHYVHELLKNLKEMRSQSFYMSSYVIYSLARMRSFDGLPGKEPQGCGPTQLKAHECYP